VARSALAASGPSRTIPSTPTNRASNSGKAQSGKGIIARFLLRYVLLGVAAYAILTSFPASLRGLFAGLFLPVGAIACEAVYEVFTGITRQS